MASRIWVSCVLLVTGCSLPRDAIGSGVVDAIRVDGGTMPGPDGGVDASFDAGPLPDSGVDAGMDAGTDAGNDAATLPDTSIPPECTGTTTRCHPGDMTMLDACASGHWTTESCSLGCIGGATPHCGTFDVSNVASSTMPSAMNVSVSTAVTIVTDGCTGWTGLTGRVVAQPGGGMVCLYDVGALTVTAAGSIAATGAYPLVIVSQGAVSIVGRIDVSSYASPSVIGAGAGTGGHAGGAGGAGTGGSNGNDGGGGGGGFGGHGGTGASEGNAAGGSGGGTQGSTLVPLIGGANGGDGSSSTGTAGHGGGAVQITSLVSIDVSGTVAAGGGGGGPGALSALSAGAGGGGGSGGGVLLEAPRITLPAATLAVTVAGGAGGSGACYTMGGDGMRGPDGASAGVGQAIGPAPGCTGVANAGAGGGGTSEDGSDVANNGGANGSGGGGATGQIAFRTRDGVLPTGIVNPSVGASHTMLMIH